MLNMVRPPQPMPWRAKMESSNLLAAQPSSFQTQSDANPFLQASPCMRTSTLKREASIKEPVPCSEPKSTWMTSELLTFSPQLDFQSHKYLYQESQFREPSLDVRFYRSRNLETEKSPLVSCHLCNVAKLTIIPAEAGIQKHRSSQKYWIPTPRPARSCLAVAGGSGRGSANPPEPFGGLADGNDRKGVAIGLFWL